LRIGRIIESAFWIPLLVCVGILAASFDRIPDLPALRQIAISSRVTQSVSHQAQTGAIRSAVTGAQAAIHLSWLESAIDRPAPLPFAYQNCARQESGSSPPSPAAL
jgi:hypothetical protein